MSSENETSNTSQNGIDIRQALEILSQRSTNDGSAAETQGKCTCSIHHAPKVTQELGQILRLNPQDEQEELQDMAAQKFSLRVEREERRKALEAKLEEMSLHDLVQAVLEAQQQRVRIYQQYNSGLDYLLETKNLSNYPRICTDATAHFAVISDTINCIEAQLASTKKNRELASLVRNLQLHEKEKLNFSAALHLERIRESQERENRVLVLVRQGIQVLELKIAACMKAVNDIIEELQCSLTE